MGICRPALASTKLPSSCGVVVGKATPLAPLLALGAEPMFRPSKASMESILYCGACTTTL